MIYSFGAAIVVVSVITGAAFYRVAVGRTVYDRLLAAGVAGTNAIVIMALAGFVFERPDMFVDLALSYALLNFIGTVAVGKYIESQEGRERQEDET